MRPSLFALTLAAGLATGVANAQDSFEIKGSDGVRLNAEIVAEFNEPWAMTFLPDGTMLVTEKSGTLQHVTQNGKKTAVEGLWEVAYGGQGGLGDVVPHPDFVNNRLVYISNAATSDGGATYGAVVTRARLEMNDGAPKLVEPEIIWSQQPRVSGRGHYSHRIAFGPQGSDQAGMLFITSGDRQKLNPAQDWDSDLGKVIRLNANGSVPTDNPFQDKGERARTFWTIGHRNLLGIDFDANGQLWTHEMGPRHGDELNRIEVGDNYGWPVVSNGDHYSGVPIPDHDTSPQFNAPEAFWVPSIAPAGFTIYGGDLFADWSGDGFIGGLAGRALIRVDMTNDSASEAARYEWGKRIREVEEGPQGAIWVLEDRSGGRLLKLTPQ